MTRTRAIFHDPEGQRYGIPTYMWRCAPEGLATLRQLRAAGLRPGGQDIAAQVLWTGIGGTRVAYLYDVGGAKPKRHATPAQRDAVNAALEARRVCPTCHVIRPYYIPRRRFGCCYTCASVVPRVSRMLTRAGKPVRSLAVAA